MGRIKHSRPRQRADPLFGCQVDEIPHCDRSPTNLPPVKIPTIATPHRIPARQKRENVFAR